MWCAGIYKSIDVRKKSHPATAGAFRRNDIYLNELRVKPPGAIWANPMTSHYYIDAASLHYHNINSCPGIDGSDKFVCVWIRTGNINHVPVIENIQLHFNDKIITYDKQSASKVFIMNTKLFNKLIKKHENDFNLNNV